MMLPLSALQRRMWHLCTAYPGSASPIVVLAHRIRGRLDPDAFRRAVAQVVDRHASLRTLFPVRDGVAWQQAGSTGRFEVELVPAADPAPHVTELSEALLDLEGGPLVRSRLIKVDDDHHVWCFAAHHLLTDGASTAVIEREVAALYRGEVLPPAPQATFQQPEGELDWWVERLRGVPVLELVPTRPAVKVAGSAHYDHRLDDELTRTLERLARRQRATLFMVLFAGYQAMLQKISGQTDFCVGTPVDGRVDPDLQDAVGLLANMLALRCDLSGEPDFQEVVRRTRATTIDALARQDVPFGQIVTALELPRDPSRTQVFQTIFTLHTEGSGGLELPGVSIEPFGVGSPRVLHDLVLDAWRTPAGLDLTFRYDTALFPADSVVELAELYEARLRAAGLEASL